MRSLKKIFLAASLLFLGACGENSIFIPIPLTLNPLVLANPIAMVASNAAQRLYVVNSNNLVLWEDASFVILDISNPANPTPLAVISIPNFSGNILLDEARGFVYLPNRQSAAEADLIDQVLRIHINEASPTFLQVDFFDSGEDPFGGFFDGVDSLYVTASREALRYDVNNMLGFSKVDLSVTTAAGREIFADDTRELALSPSGNNLFVTNRTDNMLILNVNEMTPPTVAGVTDLGTEPVDYIVVGTNSTRGAARDSNFVYVVDGAPANLRILTDAGLTPVSGPPQEITTGSLQVAAIPIGNDPGEVIIDEPNARAYVSNTGDDTVSVIDLNLQAEITRIAVDNNLPVNSDPGDQPFPMAIANVGGGNFLYVGNFDSNNITVIDADALQVVFAFPDIEPDDEEDEKEDDDNDFSGEFSPGFTGGI
ncbi:MAG: hypothetical protein IT573_04085 [Deltaproteobacteria bacterium]|nr:hypothetical protein [Deltaproteobacteria bacterium]